MISRTRTPGVLCVASALPDPPFEFMDGENPRGFDVDLMQAICSELGLQWRLARYAGEDFNGIFAGLANGAWDCVASGATITPGRTAIASFCKPYVESGQSLACNVEKTPNVHSVEDLRGMILGVQRGNTSEPVACRLKSQGRVADVQMYAYHDIDQMLNDLESGNIGAVMKLAPVMRWLIKERPALRVVQECITDEKLGVAVGLHNQELRQAIDSAQERLRERGVLGKLLTRWLLI
jgi:polar amino acid transport system substrate-binding protein